MRQFKVHFLHIGKEDEIVYADSFGINNFGHVVFYEKRQTDPPSTFQYNHETHVFQTPVIVREVAEIKYEQTEKSVFGTTLHYPIPGNKRVLNLSVSTAHVLTEEEAKKLLNILSRVAQAF